MRALLAIVASTFAVAACSPRKVEVRTEPSPAAANEAAIHMTNNLTQAVNVYVVNQGTDMFVKQVAANSTDHLPVKGIPVGTSVSLKATTADGTRTYSKQNVVLSAMYEWQVP